MGFFTAAIVPALAGAAVLVGVAATAISESVAACVNRDDLDVDYPTAR